MDFSPFTLHLFGPEGGGFFCQLLLRPSVVLLLIYIYNVYEEMCDVCSVKLDGLGFWQIRVWLVLL